MTGNRTKKSVKNRCKGRQAQKKRNRRRTNKSARKGMRGR